MTMRGTGMTGGSLGGSTTATPLPGSAGRWKLPDDTSGLQQLGQMYADMDAMSTPVVRLSLQLTRTAPPLGYHPWPGVSLPHCACPHLWGAFSMLNATPQHLLMTT